MSKPVHSMLLLLIALAARPARSQAGLDPAVDPPGNEGLTVAWADNMLTVRGRNLPGGPLKIWYMEAFCRPGSTDRDWKETVIPHATKLIEAGPDGRRLKLRSTLEDGVVVDHEILAGRDEVEFRVTAANPTSRASMAHWAQPCLRVDTFTGVKPEPNSEKYLPQCFLFIDGRLTRLPTQPWATEARYTPGQVWCPSHVDRNDVNPRPLSRLVPSSGLIGCYSADGKQILATAWEPYQELFQGVITCFHSDFRIGGLKPGEEKKIRGKLYVVDADPDALVKRYEADFPEHRPPSAHWEGHRNRLVPSPAPTTRQGFGHRPTRHAGGANPGEIGGRIQRSVTPAWYAKAIPTATLGRKLSASGRFAVTRDDGSSGALVGWFHHDSRGWRTPNSLAFRVDGNGGKYWVLFEYGTRLWSTGGGATFKGRYQTTETKPFAADGTPHAWTMTYDPKGDDEDGLITFTLDGQDYTSAVLRAHKIEGASFDRFGLFNQQLTGGGLELYVDDLVIDGVPQDFGRDPGWEGRGNEAVFEDCVIRPQHDFGHISTARAGAPPGEVGGIIWRDEAPAYYAERVGPLTLDDELVASGTIRLAAAGSDSGVYLGWFDSAAKRGKRSPEHEEPQRGLLGILIEGPSRVGHYVRPAYRTATGAGEASPEGPVIRPDGMVHRWSIRYSPKGADGRGRITVTFDDQARVLDLGPDHRAQGATFDRFGLFNVQSGGHFVELYLNDLSDKTGSGGQ